MSDTVQHDQVIVKNRQQQLEALQTERALLFISLEVLESYVNDPDGLKHLKISECYRNLYYLAKDNKIVSVSLNTDIDLKSPFLSIEKFAKEFYCFGSTEVGYYSKIQIVNELFIIYDKLLCE